MSVDVRGWRRCCLSSTCKSIRFYRDVLGFEIVSTSKNADDFGMKQLYVNDPDGYNLCFQWPATN